MILTLLVTQTSALISTAENINDKVLRLHILANSDSEYDQQLKLEIKDYIIEKTGYLFEKSESLEDAVNNVEEHLYEIENYAKEVIYKKGYNYSVKAYVKKEYFDTRKYDNFYMPAGVYNSLKIIIGDGKGHNWWCVMYPSVCLSGCIDDFDKELTEEEKKLLISEKFVPKFKIIEIYEKLKFKITAH